MPRTDRKIHNLKGGVGPFKIFHTGAMTYTIERDRKVLATVENISAAYRAAERFNRLIVAIDRLCAATTNPTILNALHACRPGHPWNGAAERPFINAHFLVAQHLGDFAAEDVQWLQDAAMDEQDAIDRRRTAR